MTQRMVFMILALFIVLGGIFGWTLFSAMKKSEFLANRPQPPVTVTAEDARAENWQTQLEGVGTLAAVHGVNLKAETAGRVTALHFESGQDIQKGAVLVQLDDSTERADLRSFQAQNVLARHDFERDSALVKKHNVAVATLDKSRAQMEQTEAMIARTRSIIDKKQVRAPFDGRLGIRRVDVGDYVEEGQTIVSLQALDTLHVNFTLPEQHLPRIAPGQAVRIRVDAHPAEEFSGRLNAIEAKVNEQTRNIEVQATVRNDQLKLRPGMFAQVRLLLPKEEGVLSVPQTAIAYSLYGDSVFVIEDQGEDDDEPILTVSRRYVTPGSLRGNRIAVVKGLDPGERVVTSGQLKLHNGSRVAVDNSIQPN